MTTKLPDRERQIPFGISLNAEELAALDMLRRDESRASYVRQIIQAHIHTKQSEEKHNGG